jgi:hypothetical protein
MSRYVGNGLIMIFLLTLITVVRQIVTVRSFRVSGKIDNSYDVATWHESMVDLSAFDIYFKVLDMIKPGYEFVDFYGPITVLNRRLY